MCESRFGHTIDMRAQLSTLEEAKLSFAMRQFARDNSITFAEYQDKEGTLWYTCGTKENFQALNHWHLGYIMALGFNAKGQRDHA